MNDQRLSDKPKSASRVAWSDLLGHMASHRIVECASRKIESYLRRCLGLGCKTTNFFQRFLQFLAGELVLALLILKNRRTILKLRFEIVAFRLHAGYLKLRLGLLKLHPLSQNCGKWNLFKNVSYAHNVMWPNETKLNHAGTPTPTALAELKALTGVGSGDLLGHRTFDCGNAEWGIIKAEEITYRAKQVENPPAGSDAAQSGQQQTGSKDNV